MDYSTSDRNVDFVNFAAAFSGYVSSNFRAIDFSASGPASFQCRVILRLENADDRQAISDALEDFEAMRRPLYELPFDMECQVLVSDSEIGHPAAHELRLFALRED
ncbi:MAG TPA: hypothetical protein VGM81_13745 [Burkholderiaceae bacterium]|jgi:hypothetical protein